MEDVLDVVEEELMDLPVTRSLSCFDLLATLLASGGGPIPTSQRNVLNRPPQRCSELTCSIVTCRMVLIELLSSACTNS